MDARRGAASFPVVSSAGPWRRGALWGAVAARGGPSCTRSQRVGEAGRDAAGWDAAGAEQVLCLGRAAGAELVLLVMPRGPPTPSPSSRSPLSPKRSPWRGLRERFPRRASVSPALAGQHGTAHLPIFRTSTRDAPSPVSGTDSCSRARPCGFRWPARAAPAAPHRQREVTRPWLTKKSGQRQHAGTGHPTNPRRTQTFPGSTPTRLHPGKPKGLRAGTGDTHRHGTRCPAGTGCHHRCGLRSVPHAKVPGWGPRSPCSPPGRTPGQAGGSTRSLPGAARCPNHEHLHFEALLRQEHVVLLPRSFGFPGHTVLSPASVGCWGRAHPASPLSRRRLRHPAFPSLNKGSISLRRRSSSSASSFFPFSLSSLFFFFLKKQEMSCLPADVTKSTLEMSATAGKGPR